MTELDGQALLRIDRAVQRFEEAWRTGNPPSLAVLLAEEADQSVRAELLRYALAVELAFRRGRGESPGVEDYEPRFPDHTPAIQAAFADETTLWRPVEKSGRPDPPATDPPATSPDARSLGKYEVIATLGGGAQGAAVLARDPDVGRLVVVKRYHAAAGDAGQEARALGRVRSPYTAQCLDLMRHGGELFLVMDYIPGRSLAEVLRQDPPAPRGAARLIEQIAEGLEAVHACGLIHRDIKPSNVIVGDDGVARLVDFGLAAHLGSEALRGISGSPPYMSPEQARDQWERIDARSDVYGLGGVLYALLTGQPPHKGTSVEQVLRHAREGRVRPPSELKPRRTVPRELERIVMKALEPDSSRRYGSAAEFRRALRRYRLQPRMRAGIAAVVAITAIGLMIPFLLPRKPPEPAAIPAVPTALSGELTVKVWGDEKDPRRALSVVDPEALPLRAGDHVRIEARLNRPAHVYLLWIDGQGEVSLVYPRNDDAFGGRPAGDQARDLVMSPDSLVKGLRMVGPGGLETVLLLAREKPLAPGIDLVQLIGQVPRSPLRDEREVAVLDFERGQPLAMTRSGQNRGIDPGKVDAIDDPILQLMERLRTRAQFEVIQAVRFAYRGETSSAGSGSSSPKSPGRNRP
jgi:serine/threonine-protein kinase